MPDQDPTDLTSVFAQLDAATTKPSDTYTPASKSWEDAQKEADAIQRRKLRYGIAIAVVLILAAELIGMFMIVVWQGRGHFQLNEWMLGFLTNGVLIQTFLGFRTIITHLFPVENGVLPSDKK